MAALLLVLTAAFAQAGASSTAAPGSALRKGMTLVYESNGKPQPPWTVLAVTPDAPLKEGAGCSIVRIERAPVPPDPPESRLCIEGGTLMLWSATQNAWQPQRPVAPGRTLTLPRANGESVRYETGGASQVTISGMTVPVVTTTVTTLEPSGRAIRRLREQYAPSLTTAVSGEFETADANASTGWRTTQTFALREIK